MGGKRHWLAAGLFLCLCGAAMGGALRLTRPAADSGIPSLAENRLGFRDNALDSFFREKLCDPRLCQAELCFYQEQYDSAWEVVYRGLTRAMLSAAQGSPSGTEAVVAFYAATDQSWNSAADAIRLSWWDFQEDVWGNGTGDYLKLYHGMYLRDRCALLADWLDITEYLPSQGALEACWQEGAMDMTAFSHLLAENGLPCGLSETESYALSCARLLSMGWDSGMNHEDGFSSFALYDLNGDGIPELVTDNRGSSSPEVYRSDGGEPLRILWGGTYGELRLLKGGILWLHDGSHLTIYDSFYQMREDSMVCLHDLQRAPISETDVLCYDGTGDREIPESEYNAILARYEELSGVDSGEQGIVWSENTQGNVARIFGNLITSSTS